MQLDSTRFIYFSSIFPDSTDDNQEDNSDDDINDKPTDDANQEHEYQ